MSPRQIIARLLVLLGLIAAPWWTSVASAAGDHPDHRVVIQVSDDNPRTMKIALNNAMNLVKALGQDNVEVEIVAYGPGLKLLERRNEAFRDRVSSLQNYDIRFAACGNTMRKMKLSKAQLVSGVTVVPAGVLEIMKRQEKGWSYVRP